MVLFFVKESLSFLNSVLLEVLYLKENNDDLNSCAPMF